MTPSHVRREGRNAFCPTLTAKYMNPYPKGHHHYQDFIDGWNEAEKQYKKEQAELDDSLIPTLIRKFNRENNYEYDDIDSIIRDGFEGKILILLIEYLNEKNT
jgi:uncharacterized protein YfbU (UPF0304 family)